MESFDLEPRYSTTEIPGKCIKCLAEQELNNCLRILLIGEEEDIDIKQRYQMLESFLRSPDAQRLCDEAERLLSEDKQVILKIQSDKDTGKQKYELEIY